MMIIFDQVLIRWVFVFVYDKFGLEDFVCGFYDVGVALVLIGGFVVFIEGFGILVMWVEDVIGFFECFDGWVKMLYLKVHVGILVDWCLDFYVQ